MSSHLTGITSSKRSSFQATNLRPYFANHENNKNAPLNNNVNTNTNTNINVNNKGNNNHNIDPTTMNDNKSNDFTNDDLNINNMNNNNNNNDNKSTLKVNKTDHIPSQSIAVTQSNNYQIEKEKNREVLWKNADLLENKPDSRKKMWKHLARTLWSLDNIPKFNYNNYKTANLPSPQDRLDENVNVNKRNNNTTSNNNNNTTHTTTNNNNDNNNLEEPIGEPMTQDRLQTYLDRSETYGHFLYDQNSSKTYIAEKKKKWNIF